MLILVIAFFIQEQTQYPLILYMNSKTAWKETNEDDCDLSSIFLNNRTSNPSPRSGVEIPLPH
jgi:hypothetical protein